jgi:hypothetical protein
LFATTELFRRRLRFAAWVAVGALVVAMFAALYFGTRHVSACATPCDCGTPTDRPCQTSPTSQNFQPTAADAATAATAAAGRERPTSPEPG